MPSSETPEACADKYRQLVGGLQLGVFVTALSGEFLEVNPRVASLTGYTEEELLRSTAQLLYVNASDRDRLIHALTAHDTVRDLEIMSRRKDGSTYWIALTAYLRRDAAGRPHSIFGIADDITARKHAEQELREARDFSQSLIETASTLVVGLDRHGRVTLFNHAAEAVTGYTRTELLGRSWFELVTPRERYPEVWREFARLEGGGIPRTFENPILTKLGEERVITWHNSQIFRGGELTGTLSFGMDVTSRRHLEAQLRQSQKLEAIGSLAGMVAHDLNNLLTPVLGYAELLQLDDSLGARQRAEIEGIVAAANRARELVAQLLAFGRKQRLEVRSDDLNAVVSDFSGLLRHALREDLELSFELSELPLPVRCDRGQIEQVIMNLAVNAQDAIPGNGRIVVGTQAVHLGEPSGAEPGPYARLFVRDTGQGMDEATRARAFEPFFTTKPKGRGTGLGLSSVYGIVAQHGGRVRVQSEPGLGTTVIIDLPRVDQPSFEAGARDERLELGRGETVLLAEDESAVREATQAMLQGLGYRVVGGTTLADCLGAASAGHIDLLLSDMVMPQASGPELVERVRTIHAGLPVLFVSGYPDDVIGSRVGFGAGTSYLQKPYTLPELARRVRQALERRQRVSRT